MRRKMVAGNWKMNGNLPGVLELILGLRGLDSLSKIIDIAVFPSYLFITHAINKLYDTGIYIGAQNSATESSEGALTGEVSTSQLASLGCKFVLVGHSERRITMSENFDVINKKISVTLAVGLTPVLCIGEGMEYYQDSSTIDFLRTQLDSIVNFFGIGVFSDLILAYEPIWAIGNITPAEPKHIQNTHRAIRAYLAEKNSKIADRIRILYGGSVTGVNAKKIFNMPDIDGFLVGRSSLSINEFCSICYTVGK